MLVFNKYRFNNQSINSETQYQDSSEVDIKHETTKQKPESSMRKDDDFKNNRKQVDDTERTYHHIPTPISPTRKKKYPQRRCVICRENGAPRDTRYCCKACFEVPALCKTPCFRTYHCKFM